MFGISPNMQPLVEKRQGVYILDSRHGDSFGTIAVFLVPSAHDDGTFMLIETASGSTLPTIEKAVNEAGYDLQGLKAILVTHIHLDHAGAAGELQAKTGAPIYVHSRGVKHLIDPSRLMDSAKRIYKDKMDTLWGTMHPAEASNVFTVDQGDTLSLLGHTVAVLYTPGHASHHVSYHFTEGPQTGTMFVGDAAGAKVPHSQVVRPTLPPPEIDLELYDESLERMRTARPTRLMLTHFGEVTAPDEHFTLVSQQNHRWAQIVLEGMNAGESDTELITRIHSLSASDLKADQVAEFVIKQHNAISNDIMSVAGLKRYWLKHHPKKVTV